MPREVISRLLKPAKTINSVPGIKPAKTVNVSKRKKK